MNNFFEILETHIEIRRSQLKTLHDLALSLIKCGTVGIASIGRSIESAAKEKHRIKRVDRFIGNPRIDCLAVADGISKLFCKKKKRVFVCIDWTDAEDKVHTIIEASLPTHSRSILLLTRAYSKTWGAEGSMNRAEENFLEELRQLFTEDQRVVILADRGFAKKGFFSKLQELKFEYIVRLKSNIWMKGRTYKGLIEDVKVKPGFRKNFGQVLLSKEHLWPCRIVGLFDKGQKEPWFLVTNTQFSFKTVVKAYGRRFEIEETNRDIKNERNGLRLRGVKFSTPARLERMLTVISVAYALMVVAGHYGEKRGIHRRLMANTSKRRTLALWRVGQYVLLTTGMEVMKLVALAPALPVT